MENPESVNKSLQFSISLCNQITTDFFNLKHWKSIVVPGMAGYPTFVR